MVWKRVENYYLGFKRPTKEFSFYYSFEGDGTVHQIFLAPEEYLALAETFRNEGPINYNTDGEYFVSAAEAVGEEETKPPIISPGVTRDINLADYVTYGSDLPADVRRSNRTGFKAAYDIANAQGLPLYLPPGVVEIEVDQSGDWISSGHGDTWIGVRMDGNVNIVGAGIQQTTIKFFPDNPTYRVYSFYQDSGRHNSISNCTITGPAFGTVEPAEWFYCIKHQGDANADIITDESLTLSNVKIDGEFFDVLDSNEGDLICTLENCDISAYIQALGYFVNNDTHKQLIVRNCYFHDTGVSSELSVLIYVSPGVAIDISHSRFASSYRYGVYINGSSLVKPLYSRITNNVFEESLAYGIYISRNNRPLIQGNLIKTYSRGISFWKSYVGAEILDNQFVLPKADSIPASASLYGWGPIAGIGWGRGTHVKIHGNTFDASVGEDVGPTTIIRLSGTGVIWDIDSNVFLLNHPGLEAITGNCNPSVPDCDQVIAFVTRNKFLSGQNSNCINFQGGILHAKDNIFADGFKAAFTFQFDQLVRAYLDDNDLGETVIPLHVALTTASSGKIEGSGNRFFETPTVVGPGDVYQMIVPRTGVSPNTVAAAGQVFLPVGYDTVHITGAVKINDFFFGSEKASKLFSGEVRIIFDDQGAAITHEGNIRPLTTDARIPGRVYRFMHDSTTGRWIE